MKKFEITLAINEGYFHNNELDISLEDISQIWQNLQQENNIYISANIFKQRTCYSEKFGCPLGGEISFLLSGLQNMEFYPSEIDWKKDIVILASQLRQIFNQTRVYIVFYDVECHILADKI